MKTSTLCLLCSVLLVTSEASFGHDDIQVKKERLLQRLHDGDDNVINIKTLGAVGDGKHNDTEPFLQAMKIVSAGLQVPVLIPDGTFLMWPVAFPCKNARLVVSGTVLAAPADAGWTQTEYFWRVEQPVNCTITGMVDEYSPLGGIAGQGQRWWEMRSEAPSLILFKGFVGSYPESGVYNISLSNAPGAHVTVTDSLMYGGPVISGVSIYSPRNSYNTIGVQAFNASFRIDHSDISTSGSNLLLFCGRGDNNAAFVNADAVRFGYGDGVTLVMYDGIMGNISFFNTEFEGTTYGLRVLGASDGTGQVINVMLYGSRMIDVGTPLEVSNTGCPLNRHDCTGSSEGVRIFYVSASQLTAFQTSGTAGRFQCRSDRPCEISLNDIAISSAGSTAQNRFICSNAQGYAYSTSPPSCLTQPHY